VRLAEDEARALFAAARVARLATADAHGRPHVVPVTFAVDGDTIYTAVDHKPKTSTTLKRLRNVAENPQVSLLADHYADDWETLWWARADGAATITTSAGPIALLATRYAQYKTAPPPGPFLTIAVERWSGWAARP
jgi:PPOX class probable F420-dependent enzyme